VYLSARSSCAQSLYERYRFSTLAGAIPASRDGTGKDARFDHPTGIATDANGNFYVADIETATIRKISSAGVVTTLAGLAYATGSVDGAGSAARFNQPVGIAVDSAGNVYVADSFNHTIRKIAPAGVVTTFAGLAGTRGSTDGKGSAARFNTPQGLGLDPAGNVFVADTGNNAIRKITPDGTVTTVANGVASFGVAVDQAGNIYVANLQNRIDRITPGGVLTPFAGTGAAGSADGPANVAQFNGPRGITVDSAGNIFVADFRNHTIRKVTSAGVVSTVAGLANTSGSADGDGDLARFYYPYALVPGSAGELYVADTYNGTIRKITPSRAVSTFAGLATQGSADGAGANAQFSAPGGIAVDGAGNIYVADKGNNTIRKITPDSAVSTFAGSPGVQGSADGFRTQARFNRPTGLAVDTLGNVYVGDTSNNTIRKINSAGVVTTIAGSPPPDNPGSNDGQGSVARFSLPKGLAVDGAGNIYVADYFNHTIRKITPTGLVSTFAGSPNPGSPGQLIDGTGSGARFSYVDGVAVDNAGYLYVADGGNSAIRKISPTAVVTTLARVNNSGVALDAAGNIYVTGYVNDNTIRKITPSGIITTLAGTGAQGSADGTGSAARFNVPTGIAVNGAGYVYVADLGNNAIRVGGPTAISQSLNISTRLRVQPGDNALIAGFILNGSVSKKVILRAIGPTLADSGVSGGLLDPTLELHGANGVLLTSNDNWKINDQTQQSQEAEVRATGLPPSNDLESAIIATLAPDQNYTAILRGKGNAAGVALVEAYDLAPAIDSLLANISTRGFVESGNNVMIGGFILGGESGASEVMLRAIGPSLAQAGINNFLPDPMLELRDGHGALIASNDNWKDAQRAEIEATRIAPSNDLESAIVASLPPGNYTAIVAGKGGGTGIGLVEIYNLQ
jgi:sugar lactone lactonase YvrE